MPQGIAVTHVDLDPKGQGQGTNLDSKTGVFLIVSTILCGVLSFILCVIAETTRSKVTWKSYDSANMGADYECIYSGNGKTPLRCAAGAFAGLAVAMIVEHSCILIAVSRTPPPLFVTWEPDYGYPKNLTRQATILFILTWICFAVAELLLLIGISVESGHLKNWSRPKPSCLVVRRGLFSATAAFVLATVLLAAGLYIAVVQMLKKIIVLEKLRRQAFETPELYAYPQGSHWHMAAATRENPVRVEHQIAQPLYSSSKVLVKKTF